MGEAISIRSRQAFQFIWHRYKVLEFSTYDQGILPQAPSDEEKYLYAERHIAILLVTSVISFLCISVSLASFIIHHPLLWILIFCLVLNIMYFLVSLLVNVGTSDFKLKLHRQEVEAWHPDVYPSVDIFLPTAGEDPRVIENTWIGVKRLASAYIGTVTVYALDDGNSVDVKEMAQRFGYHYVVRPDRGYFKKAGNLRHGFKISSSRFIVIFDADFVPRSDFLYETLPYFRNRKLVLSRHRNILA